MLAGTITRRASLVGAAEGRGAGTVAGTVVAGVGVDTAVVAGRVLAASAVVDVLGACWTLRRPPDAAVDAQPPSTNATPTTARRAVTARALDRPIGRHRTDRRATASVTPMTWELSDEHELLRKTVREFAEGEIAPHAATWDETHHFPVDVVRQMGELGLFGIVFPERWGGGGGDFSSLCVAIEELGRVDQSMGITLSAGVGLGANPIYRFGTDEQRDRWLPDLVAGRALGAFGLTEPDGGSDAGATRTRAELDDADEQWVIDGSKAFITNCGTSITSVVSVTARTEDGISAFVVPSGTPGMIIEPPYRKLGWHASDTHGITLDGCRVPRDHLLGRPGEGFRNFLAILDDGRIAISALALGSARACLELAVEYAGQRHAFGGPIGRFQGLAFQLADLAVQVENAHNLTYKAAWLKDQGRPIGTAAAMAKLYSTEAAMDAARVATQVLGGLGFIEETPATRFYRDAKILEIGEGTSEIQRLVIARGLGLPVAN